jgi:hypothetical protein
LGLRPALPLETSDASVSRIEGGAFEAASS